MKQNLFNLRAAINQDRAILNTIQRQLDRIDGKEVFFSDWEDDANYLQSRTGIPRDACYNYDYLVAFRRSTLLNLNAKRDQAARIRAELPLTPCGFVVALFRAKRIQARQRKRNKRRR